MTGGKNVIVDKTFKFSLEIIKYTEVLEEKRKYVVAKQLMKSGTSIGANVHEAQSGESKADFIHKLKIADKEAHETEYWLKLCEHSESYPDTKNLQKDLIEIKRILSAIISSSKPKKSGLYKDVQ